MKIKLVIFFLCASLNLCAMDNNNKVISRAIEHEVFKTNKKEIVICHLDWDPVQQCGKDFEKLKGQAALTALDNHMNSTVTKVISEQDDIKDKIKYWVNSYPYEDVDFVGAKFIVYGILPSTGSDKSYLNIIAQLKTNEQPFIVVAYEGDEKNVAEKLRERFPDHSIIVFSNQGYLYYVLFGFSVVILAGFLYYFK